LGRLLGLVELPEVGVAHRQCTPRERRADEVLSLLHERDRLFQGTDALADGTEEDLVQADDGELQRPQRGIVEGVTDLGHPVERAFDFWI